MANLIKDKNYLVFTNNSDRTYKLDIASGVFYSTKGTPMKSCPSGFATYMKDAYRNSMLLRYIYNKHQYNNTSYAELAPYAEMMGVCDRLDSIGYVGNRWYDIDEKALRFVKDNFKAFAKAFKDNEELTIEQFRNDYGRIAMLKEIGIKVDDYYTESIVDKLWAMREEFSASELKLIAYYLSRGVYMFCGDHYHFRSMFKNFFEWCEVIGYKATKDDFFKQYILVKKNYIANKAEYDNRKIVNHLAKHSHIWEFENDEFCIVVPQTSEDFKREGDSQQNCVYTMYLQKVIEGNTNVVFVRRKSEPEKSFITCEVDNCGNMRQYYYKGNCWVDETTAEGEFKRKFVEFIRANWYK